MTTLDDPEQAGNRLELPRAVFWIAIAFSSFQVYTAAFSPLSSQVVRAIHVGFVLLKLGGAGIGAALSVGGQQGVITAHDGVLMGR